MFRRLKKLVRGAAPPAPPRPAVMRAPRPAPLAQPVPAGVPSPDQPRSLALYKYDACPYCRRVQQALQGMEVAVTMRDTLKDTEASRELRALTGGSQVPCLVIDGVPLLESLDIIAWLQTYQSSGSSSSSSSSSPSPA